MKDLNFVANEITKGNNLEMNLPKFANSMMSLYNGLAYIKLSMNYYTYFEILNDKEYENTDLAKIKELVGRLNVVIEKEVINDETVDTSKESLEEVENIRNEIIKIMEIITSYVDKLGIYEHILNRVEFNFSEDEFDEEYYMNNLTNDLMHYILSDKDRMALNGKIKEIVGQLPVRMSKEKFYSYISDAFSIYNGAQEGTVDDFVYTLRTTAMLDQTLEFQDSFENVNEIMKDLKNADYKSLDFEGYRSLADKLFIATQIMTKTSDLFVILTQLVNDVYTIILSKMYAFNDVDEISKSKFIIKSTHNSFVDSEFEYDENEIMNCFTSFEGQQEKIITATTTNEFAIDYILKNDSSTLNAFMLEHVFNSLSIISKLQSGSDFIQLYASVNKLKIATPEYVLSACKRLILELDNQFKDSNKIVNRAVMSTILSQLPVFFNNIDEIQNYINSSLLQCSDKAEKMAFVEVTKILMSSEN